MIDKNFCACSYLAFRYIEKEDMNFYEGLKHVNYVPLPESKRVLVDSAEEIDVIIRKTFDSLKSEKLGIMLSGGMDSAILASYMPGATAYTFRFLNGEYQQDELKRAEYYANYYGLELHYVDISWSDVVEFLPDVMRGKHAPVHSIEPQIYKAAIMAKNHGITKMVVGESADLVFGGMDQLLAKDWGFDEFVKRYIFLNPEEVLVEPQNVTYLFEKYRQNDKINFLQFMDEVFAVESSGSYLNAFECAKMPYIDPYANMKMAKTLDLQRIRNGESKYLIRELFHMKYSDIPIPEKVPMPRPVDFYFANWEGPTRKEFRPNLNMDKFTGNQKWQMYCLQEFMNMYEPE